MNHHLDTLGRQFNELLIQKNGMISQIHPLRPLFRTFSSLNVINIYTCLQVSGEIMAPACIEQKIKTTSLTNKPISGRLYSSRLRWWDCTVFPFTAGYMIYRSWYIGPSMPIYLIIADTPKVSLPSHTLVKQDTFTILIIAVGLPHGRWGNNSPI